MRTKLFTLGLAALLPCLAWALPARAAACVNDTDCPTAACGGEVCQWSSNDSVMTCVAAGTNAQGMDGWCSTNADCKCMGEGATCAAPHCTFTLPKDGGASATDASTTATPDASSETTDAAAPTSDAATSTPEEASTPTGDATTSAGGTTSSKSGGCSLGASGAPGASMWGLAVVGLAVIARKRRRS